MPKPLSQPFFKRNTILVAQELVGCVLEVGAGVSGRIVEVEAYLGEDDPASHASRGRTPRSEIMFGPPGFAYVYLIYGMHHCLNFVTEEVGTAGAVLVRAVEPLTGRETMAQRRGLDPRRARDRDLTAGPGKLCQALGIDREWNGIPVVPGVSDSRTFPHGRLRIFVGEGPPGGPARTTRIGIRQATDRLFRFLDPSSRCLSG
jgi:DNA-3-methyladenine glycosylase